MLRRCVWSRNIKNGCSIYIYIYDISSLKVNDLILILLTWRKWWANNASKKQMEFNSGFKGLSCFYIGYVFYFVVGCIMCDVLLKYAFLCTNILLGIKNALYSLFIYLFVCFLCYHEYHTICMFIASQMYPGVLFMGLLCCKRHREKASLYTKVKVTWHCHWLAIWDHWHVPKHYRQWLDKVWITDSLELGCFVKERQGSYSKNNCDRSQ